MDSCNDFLKAAQQMQATLQSANKAAVILAPNFIGFNGSLFMAIQMCVASIYAGEIHTYSDFVTMFTNMGTGSFTNDCAQDGPITDMLNQYLSFFHQIVDFVNQACSHSIDFPTDYWNQFYYVLAPALAFGPLPSRIPPTIACLSFDVNGIPVDLEMYLDALSSITVGGNYSDEVTWVVNQLATTLTC